MTVQIDKIDRLLDWAASEQTKKDLGLPSEWDQSVWGRLDPVCGTACCIAGKAVLDNGAQMIFETWEGRRLAFSAHMAEGRMSIGGWASKLLGLDVYDSEELFDSVNSLEDLRRIRDNIAEEYGLPLRWRKPDAEMLIETTAEPVVEETKADELQPV